jgi:hypothetical protein
VTCGGTCVDAAESPVSGNPSAAAAQGRPDIQPLASTSTPSSATPAARA